MNFLDQVIILFIIVGAVIGLFRGFFKEIVGTIGLLAAAIVANLVSPYTIPYIGGWIDNETFAAILVWVIVFIATMFIMSQIAVLLSKVMKAASIGWVNKIAGALFAAIKFCLIAALIISVIEIVCSKVDGLPIAEYIEGSQMVPQLHDLVDIIMPWCSEHILNPAVELLKK